MSFTLIIDNSLDINIPFKYSITKDHSVGHYRIIEYNDKRNYYRIFIGKPFYKLHGLKWNGKRPDLLIIKSTESDLPNKSIDKYQDWIYSYVSPVLAMDSQIINLTSVPI